MSADVLREAAALMRERANVPLAGRWHVDPADHDFDPHGGPHVRYTSEDSNYSCSVAYGVWPENVEHIASWHPAVALAVADWLEESADHLEDQSGFPREYVCPTALEGLECSVLGQALAVARAYLSDQP